MPPRRSLPAEPEEFASVVVERGRRAAALWHDRNRRALPSLPQQSPQGRAPVWRRRLQEESRGRSLRRVQAEPSMNANLPRSSGCAAAVRAIRGRRAERCRPSARTRRRRGEPRGPDRVRPRSPCGNPGRGETMIRPARSTVRPGGRTRCRSARGSSDAPSRDRENRAPTTGARRRKTRLLRPGTVANIHQRYPSKWSVASLATTSETSVAS